MSFFYQGRGIVAITLPMKDKGPELVGYRIYGSKYDVNCTRLVELLEAVEIAHTLVDLKDWPPTDEQILKWGEFEGEEYPVNGRSTPFKKIERVFKKMTKTEQLEWIRKNPHVISRPVVEDETGTVLAIGGRPERVAKNVFLINVE